MFRNWKQHSKQILQSYGGKIKDNRKIVSHATKTESMSQVYMYMSIVQV